MDNINNFFCEIENHFGWQLDNESYVDYSIINIKLSYAIKDNKSKKYEYNTENEGNYLILKSDDFNLKLINKKIDSLIQNGKKIVKFSSVNGKISNIEIKIKHNKIFDFNICNIKEFIEKQFSNTPNFYYYKNNSLELLINTTFLPFIDESPELSLYEYIKEDDNYIIPDNKSIELQKFLMDNNLVIKHLSYYNNTISNILVYLKKK